MALGGVTTGGQLALVGGPAAAQTSAREPLRASLAESPAGDAGAVVGSGPVSALAPRWSVGGSGAPRGGCRWRGVQGQEAASVQCRCGAGSAPELVSRLPRFSYVSWSKFPWLRWEAGAGREGWPFAPPSAVCRMGHARWLWPGSRCRQPAAEERRVGPASGVGASAPTQDFLGVSCPAVVGHVAAGQA